MSQLGGDVGNQRADEGVRLPAVQQAGPGVWSVPVPIPNNPLGYTLAYLLESSRGPVLVDAGWDDLASRSALTAGISAAGARLEDVYGVLVTHHHFDHYGLAHFVRECSGAWVALHTADAAIIQQRAAAPRDDRRRESLAEIFHAAGAPHEVIAGLPEDEQGRRHSSPPPPPDRELVDQQLVDVPGQQVRAIHTPGHTPGHMCFYLEKQRRLFAGDHLLPGITPHIALYEPTGSDKDPLGDFFTSLARLASIEFHEALPAHEYRFTEPKARAEQITKHHQTRLREIEAALQVCPLTLWEVAERMAWNRPWSELGAMARRMALGEAAAHLQFLHQRHRVVAVNSVAPVRYCLATPSIDGKTSNHVTVRQ